MYGHTARESTPYSREVDGELETLHIQMPIRKNDSNFEFGPDHNCSFIPYPRLGNYKALQLDKIEAVPS